MRSLSLLGKRVIIVPSKRVVFVIVEGPTDEDALGVLFERYFDKNTVRVKVVHGDITSERLVNSSNILNHIADILKKSLKEYKLQKTDLLRVIHLVDTDGAFVPDSAVVCDANHERPYYTETEIKTANPEGVIIRNQKKRANLTKLHNAQSIWGIPYSVYFMSCNLDHALYDKMNLTDDEKEKEALQFARKYKNDLPKFIEFANKSSFSVVDDYLSSWSFIKQGLHSLERYSNIGLCFHDQEPSEEKE